MEYNVIHLNKNVQIANTLINDRKIFKRQWQNEPLKKKIKHKTLYFIHIHTTIELVNARIRWLSLSIVSKRII